MMKKTLVTGMAVLLTAASLAGCQSKNTVRHVIYSDVAKDVQNFSGVCSFEWRQGVKHDCSKVME